MEQFTTFFFGKRGGASFDDPEILNNFIEKEDDNCDFKVDVVSAIGCTTNVLRHIYNFKVDKKIDKKLKEKNISDLKDYLYETHLNLIKELFKNSPEQYRLIKGEIEKDLGELSEIISGSYTEGQEDNLYATMLQYGERMSSKIYYHASIAMGKKDVQWLDARDFVLMNKIKNGEIFLINPSFSQEIRKHKRTVIQGFIGRSTNGADSVGEFDSSDDSLAFLASSQFSPENIVISSFWKEYPGVAAEDPKKKKDGITYFSKMTNEEYLELVKINGAYPVKPKAIIQFQKKIRINVQNKVFIRSYKDLSIPGTEIIYE